MLVFESQSFSESEGKNVNLVLGRMYKASDRNKISFSIFKNSRFNYYHSNITSHLQFSEIIPEETDFIE